MTPAGHAAYIYLHGKQIAEAVIGGTTQYVHTDALGSPVAHTNQAGSELNRTKFEPYGYTAAGAKPGATTAGLITTGSAIGFTGHVNDPDTDLAYMQQRYYDPIAGRFLSVDPVVTDAHTAANFNRYHYAKNNPFKYLDQDGRAAISVEGCRVGCTGVTAGYAKGELALTINIGIGLGGGASIDPRSDQNGRINDGPGGEGHPIAGITVAGYTKASVEINTPAVSGGGGIKLSGGRDLGTGKNIGGPSVEAAASKPGAIGGHATQQSGTEISVYIKPENALQAAATALTSRIVSAVKELLMAPPPSF